MNQQQIYSALRTIIAILGGVAVGKGWLTKEQLELLGGDQAMAVIYAVLGLLGGSAAGAWGLIAHKQANAVAVVAAMPEVAKVETTATPAGRDLAEAVGSKPEAVVAVAPAGAPATPAVAGESATTITTTATPKELTNEPA